MCTKICIAAFAFVGVAGAQPEIILGSELSGFAPISDASIEARFKPETTNWDTRIGVSGVAKPTEVTGAVGNGRNAFEYQSFDYTLQYSKSARQYAISISKSGDKPSVIELTDEQVTGINSIRFDASGTRGAIGATQFYFKSENYAGAEIPDLAADMKGSTTDSLMLYFGEKADLTDGDWAIFGKVDFGYFDRTNPAEGVKLTVTMASVQPIPQPATAAIFAIASLCGIRRSRRRGD